MGEATTGYETVKIKYILNSVEVVKCQFTTDVTSRHFTRKVHLCHISDWSVIKRGCKKVKGHENYLS